MTRTVRLAVLALLAACVAVLSGCELLVPAFGGGSATPVPSLGGGSATAAPSRDPDVPSPSVDFDPAADAPVVRLQAADAAAVPGSLFYLQWSSGQFEAHGEPVAMLERSTISVDAAPGALLTLLVNDPAVGDVAHASLYPPDEWARGPRDAGEVLARLEPFPDGHRLVIGDMPEGDWVLVADVRFTTIGGAMGRGAGRYAWRLTVHP